MGYIADLDDDNDGVFDVDDAFPLDSSESVDTDSDGVGDNTDADPFNPLVGLDLVEIAPDELIGAETTTYKFVLIPTELSAVDEPDFATQYRYGAYELDEDGSFTFVNGGDASKGIWRLEDGLLRIDETQSLISFTQPQANWQNFDIEAWEAAGISWWHWRHFVRVPSGSHRRDG